MERPGFVVTTNQLLFHVWGWDSDVDCSVVWVHISNIRKSWPGWAPRQGYASCGGRGMCWKVVQ